MLSWHCKLAMLANALGLIAWQTLRGGVPTTSGPQHILPPAMCPSQPRQPTQPRIPPNCQTGGLDHPDLGMHFGDRHSIVGKSFSPNCSIHQCCDHHTV